MPNNFANDRVAFWTCQVEVKEGLTTFDHHCTEASANCLKPLVRVQNIGGRVDSPEAIDVELMVQKLLQEKKQMHSQNILHFSTQKTKETLQTSTSR